MYVLHIQSAFLQQGFQHDLNSIFVDDVIHLHMHREFMSLSKNNNLKTKKANPIKLQFCCPTYSSLYEHNTLCFLCLAPSVC